MRRDRYRRAGTQALFGQIHEHLPALVGDAREAGADAYVEKSAGAAQIAKVLREFLADEVEDENAPTIPDKLSKRQKQLLVMLDRGLSNRDIAEQLQISEHTVKVHLWRLFRRLNVKSRSQASHLARTAGLLDL